MKKICVLLFVLAMVFTGCQNAENENPTTEKQNSESTQPAALNTDSLAERVDSYVGSGGTAPKPDATEEGDGSGEIPNGTEPQEAGDPPSSEDGSADGEGTTASTADFDEKDDTVYATTNVVVRNKPSIAGDPVMNLKKGKSVHRVGYSAGWTKVEMKGYFYYIATQYLSETP